MKVMVSACLLGVNCKYSGGNNRNEDLLVFLKDKEVIQVCPEVLGGLPTPRTCCERKKDQVLTSEGDDVSQEFLQGAKIGVDLAKAEKVDLVITQPRSPSCGKGEIYDGNFQGKLISGNGCFVEELLKNGISVMNCDEFLNKYR